MNSGTLRQSKEIPGLERFIYVFSLSIFSGSEQYVSSST